jgi:hypothetical protein
MNSGSLVKAFPSPNIWHGKSLNSSLRISIWSVLGDRITAVPSKGHDNPRAFACEREGNAQTGGAQLDKVFEGLRLRRRILARIAQGGMVGGSDC